MHPWELTNEELEPQMENALDAVKKGHIQKHYKMILGHGWLKRHDPLISWVKETIKFRTTYCRSHCLKNYLPYEHAHNYLNLTRYELPLPRTSSQYNKSMTANYGKECEDVLLKPFKIYII